VHEPVALGIGLRGREPQIGCPPMKRGDPSAAAATLAFVDATSVTVVASALAPSVAWTWAAACAMGAATTARSAPSTASSSDEATSSTAPRPNAVSAACGSAS
jgi:hypothetical protein